MADVLIIDDDQAFTAGLAEHLRLQGHKAIAANSLGAARRALEEKIPTLLLLDLMLPDGSGLELLEELKERTPKKTVLVTGQPGIKTMIQDLAGPGVTYLTKPVEPRELIGILNALEYEDTAKVDDAELHFGLLIGETPQMLDVYEKIRQVAPTDMTVFIQGESGTGKELVADAIHRLSNRPGPFVPVNCGGFSKDLVASELFGHEKGSFTGASRQHRGFFERASNGTLFLDEISEMPVDMQAQLLRVLESGEITRVGGESELTADARLIAATNRDPAEAVKDGCLREDLYFRLRVFPIELPPLRERVPDIGPLTEYFVSTLNEKYNKKKSVPAETVAAFESHTWPGNVRELKHVVHRAFVLADDDDAPLDPPSKFDEPLADARTGLEIGRSIRDVERDLILSTLEHYGGDKKAAAATLGISLRTLYNRLEDYGINS